jgi:acetyl esterase/lipase
MRSWIRRLMFLVAFVFAFAVLGVGVLYWYYHPKYERIDGVIYGHRNGQALTMDVFKPQVPNGRAVAFMASGRWKSKRPGIAEARMFAPLLRSGYTIFAVCHVSQPESKIPEIIEDVTRGIRFIRYHAGEYGIDPNRIGVTGGSAGGHLCLMLATRGGESHPNPRDEIDRESGAVQAVAIFYPVTDFLNMQGSTEDSGGKGPPLSFVDAFEVEATEPQKWKDIGYRASPIYFVTDKLPPILIYHGDADTLVPLDQSERFRDRARSVGREVKIVVHRGGGHGWRTMYFDSRTFARWFDEHLLGR